jgi:hypothetical protein
VELRPDISDRDDPLLAHAGLDEVRRNMASTGLPAERIAYVRGKVEDTIDWAGARKAVDEFFADRADAPLLSRVDASGCVDVKLA